MRPIDADALLKGKDDHEMISTHLIFNAPTLDVKPVVKGRWKPLIQENGDDYYEAYDIKGIHTFAIDYQCQCGFIHSCIENNGIYEFCPRCGADMRESEDKE